MVGRRVTHPHVCEPRFQFIAIADEFVMCC